LACSCDEPPFHYLDFRDEDLGVDPHHAEVMLDTCKKCGTMWLVYIKEEAHYTRSGRWWRVPISREEREALTVADAKPFIERSPWCFVGGSFHDSPGFRVSAPIVVQ